MGEMFTYITFQISFFLSLFSFFSLLVSRLVILTSVHFPCFLPLFPFTFFCLSCFPASRILSYLFWKPMCHLLASFSSSPYHYLFSSLQLSLVSSPSHLFHFLSFHVPTFSVLSFQHLLHCSSSTGWFTPIHFSLFPGPPPSFAWQKLRLERLSNCGCIATYKMATETS